MSSRELLGYQCRNSYNVETPAPVGYSMGRNVLGSYDGLVLQPASGSTWRRFPNNNKLLKNPFFVPQTGGVPLRNEEQYVDIPNDSMFYFAKNKASPWCCPSTYSTSNGCVCTTKQQRDFIGLARGGNNSYGFLGNPQV